AEAVGDAITFVSREEEGDFRAIEAAVGRRIDRVTLPHFDYTARATERLEVPLAQRITEIRARKADERARARRNAERRALAPAGFRGRPSAPAAGAGEGPRSYRPLA